MCVSMLFMDCSITQCQGYTDDSLRDSICILMSVCVIDEAEFLGISEQSARL